jgi:dTDP-4-dehydrorhamnose reductase
MSHTIIIRNLGHYIGKETIMNTKPTLLVTGLSGMVGNRFAQLYGEKYDFVNLDLTSGIDITNEASVDNVFSENPHSVGIIHLAAFTNLNAAADQEGNKNGVCYQVNVTGTEVIAKAAARHKKFMIHISTDYVFDGEKSEAYTETDSPNPIEWYGKTKYMAEKAVEAAGVDYVILRLAFPYQTNPMRPDFIAKIRSGFENHSLYPLFTDHFITPTFVDDVAAMFDYAIEHKPTGLYHMTGSSSHSDFEIGQMVKAVFGYEDEVQSGLLEAYLEANPRPYQKSLKIDNSNLQKEFGIRMKTLDEGLAEIKNQL